MTGSNSVLDEIQLWWIVTNGDRKADNSAAKSYPKEVSAAFSVSLFHLWILIKVQTYPLKINTWRQGYLIGFETSGRQRKYSSSAIGKCVHWGIRRVQGAKQSPM